MVNTNVDTKKDQLVAIGKSLPILSITILLLGYFKFYILFKFGFAIDISSYITVSDLTFIASPDIFQIAFSSLVFGPLLLLAYLYANSEIEERETISDPKKNNKTVFFVLFFLLLASSALIILLDNFSYKLFAACISLIISFLFTIIFLPNKYKLSFTSFFRYTIIIFLIVVMILSTEKTYQKIINGHYTGTLIRTKAGNIISDERFMYVGKTNNYYFFMNLENNTKKIIPASEVLSIEIKEK